jgi:hypothetical protein
MFFDYNNKNLKSNNHVDLDNLKKLLMTFNDIYIY